MLLFLIAKKKNLKSVLISSTRMAEKIHSIFYETKKMEWNRVIEGKN